MTYDSILKFGQAWSSSIAACIVGGTTGIATWYFNNKQRKLAEEKLRRDLFERRYAAWQSAYDLWEIIYRNESFAKFEEVRPLASKSIAGVQSAKLLFTDERVLSCVGEYVNECSDLLAKIEMYKVLPDNAEPHDADFHFERALFNVEVSHLHIDRDSLMRELQRAMHLKETF